MALHESRWPSRNRHQARNLGDLYRPGSRPAVETFATKLVTLLPARPAPPLVQAKEVYIPEPSKEVFAVWAGDGGEVPEREGMQGALGGKVQLRWKPMVRDLDLHLVDTETGDVVSYRNPKLSHATLDNDGFNGGPEVAKFFVTGRAIAIEVHLYSEEVEDVSLASPVVTITTLKSEVTFVLDAGSLTNSRIWPVASIAANGVLVSNDSAHHATKFDH